MKEPVALPTRPASRVERVSGFLVTVTFDLDTGKWNWSATRPVQTEIRLTGTAGSPAMALAAARRRIERL